MSRLDAAATRILLSVSLALTFEPEQAVSPDDFIVDHMSRVHYSSLVMEIAQSAHGIALPELPQGWMSPYSAYVVTALSRTQRQLGVSGTVGEIGVHHGLFFIALAHTALRGERLFACDVFGQQHLNVDDSGLGDRELFESSLRRFGVDPAQVSIYEGDSRHLTPAVLRSRLSISPFRLLSLDGGHGVQTVEKDLRLAEASMIDGGIVVLDDFTNDDWMGVREGFFHFVLFDERGIRRKLPPQLAPFLLIANKLFLTNPGRHAAMLEAVRIDPALSEIGLRTLPYADGVPGGNTNLTGWPVAVVDDRWKKVRAQSLVVLWDQLLSEELDMAYMPMVVPLN